MRTSRRNDSCRHQTGCSAFHCITYRRRCHRKTILKMVIHNLNVLEGSRHSSFGDSSEIFNTSGVYVFRLETLNTEMSPIEKPSNLSDGSAGTIHSDGLCAFCNAHPQHILCFFGKTIQEEYISIKFDKFHAVHEEPEHKSYFCTHGSPWTVLYMSTCFLSVKR